MNINFYIICDDDNLYINNKLQKINKKLKNKYKNVYLFKSITNKNIKTYLTINEFTYDFNNNIDLKNNINYYNILKNHDKSKHICIIPSNINDINNIKYFIKYFYNLNNFKVNDYDIINYIYNKDKCIFINSNIISNILKENINIKYDNYKNTTILLNNLKNIIDNDDKNDSNVGNDDDKNDINNNNDKNNDKNKHNLPLNKKNTNSNKFKNLNRNILRRR